MFGVGLVCCEDVLFEDVGEVLWFIYYCSIFNLVCLKVVMMKREMLVCYWV